MPDNRPNEDRYTNQPEFLSPRGHDPSYMDKPRKQNVIEKLTAPPETFLEHAERIGLNVNVNDIMSGDGTLLRRHFNINFSEDELKRAEGR